ncbi:MAG: DNA-processing protein DprA [Acidimicrobiia bacterium]|nr:DNA-processing protein DprA [Acidimicrobiia bacterium]MXX45751.1 DNA-processing protein DprA [Acidimicrobiia bacterium]MXY75099.1 DNA-processing protein DprA [Acidimicrobiia bacterium]MYB79909.1 DNA-processing protein DprA [Acidimicrobiia bacterium]MYD41244.1 DNA-processing protein DprA [Acidimicrobiia bacterium]
MRNEDSLVTILLVSRIRSKGMQPLSAPEYWKLREACPRPGDLLGRTEEQLVGVYGLCRRLASRIVVLLERIRAMAFELEQLEHSGIWTVTPFDEHYPGHLQNRLRSKAPATVHAAGALELFEQPGIGVVGSRDVSPEGAEMAKNIAAKAADLGLSVVSGGARGVDQLAMRAAFQAGGNVIGVLADSLVRKLRNPDVRRAIHKDRTLMCTPYSPETPFRVWTAMGRNKLIYALSKITVVVACETDRGGTWSGATEALEAGLGRVGVWRGPGEGPGNQLLEERGAQPIRSINELETVWEGRGLDVEKQSGGDYPRPEQASLFEKSVVSGL